LLVLGYLIDAVEHERGFLDIFDHGLEMLILVEEVIKLSKHTGTFGIILDFRLFEFGAVELVSTFGSNLIM
jgi:hypothetical protein